MDQKVCTNTGRNGSVHQIDLSGASRTGRDIENSVDWRRRPSLREISENRTETTRTRDTAIHQAAVRMW